MAVNFKGHLLNKKTLINLINIFSLFIICGDAAKLTVPRILLPYNTGVPTNYTLEVKEGGCYKWYSTSLINMFNFSLLLINIKVTHTYSTIYKISGKVWRSL